MSIEDLRKGAFSVMALIQTSFCGGQLKIEYSPDVKDLTQNLNTSVLCLIDLMRQHPLGQEKLSRFKMPELIADYVDEQGTWHPVPVVEDMLQYFITRYLSAHS